MIAKYDIKRVLVDNKNSTNILFYDAFSKINLIGQLRWIETPLIRFSENLVATKGEITLPVTMRQEPRQSMEIGRAHV